MRLLLDIGNTATHAALAGRRIRTDQSLPTADWMNGRMAAKLKRFIGRETVTEAIACSVVPAATRAARLQCRDAVLARELGDVSPGAGVPAFAFAAVGRLPEIKASEP